ncbi:hypothetical protein ZWY2020_057522 [Hordeum vulgare]|nr:hypothetical protein ZWY2020_057522 [Hordeum vulgare]
MPALLPTVHAGAGEAQAKSRARRFASASGAQFMVGGRPSTGGFNAFWLMCMAWNHGDRRKVLDALDQPSRLGATIIRTWAFSDGGDSSRLQITPPSTVRKYLWCIFVSPFSGEFR